jgi:hypothetical protein
VQMRRRLRGGARPSLMAERRSASACVE